MKPWRYMTFFPDIRSGKDLIYEFFSISLKVNSLTKVIKDWKLGHTIEEKEQIQSSPQVTVPDLLLWLRLAGYLL
jgi:hypothetical protein